MPHPLTASSAVHLTARPPRRLCLGLLLGLVCCGSGPVWAESGSTGLFDRWYAGVGIGWSLILGIAFHMAPFSKN